MIVNSELEGSNAAGGGVTISGVTTASRRFLERFSFALPVALIVAVLLAYASSLAVKPLLDEQYLLSWIKSAGGHGVPFSTFVNWRGPSAADLWGIGTPVVLKVSSLLAFGTPFLMRAQSMILHALAAVLLFFVVKKVTDETAPSAVAALLFALYPLAPESVFWIGGRGSQLAGLLSLSALFMHTHSIKFIAAPARAIGAVVLFALAILCSAQVWPLAFVFAAWTAIEKLVLKRPVSQFDFTLSIMTPLAILLMVACYFAGTGMLWMMLNDAAPNLRPAAVFGTLRDLFFPINESIAPKYVRHYRFLYFLLAPCVVSLAVALWRRPRLRSSVCFFALWLLLAVLPVSGQIDVRGTLFGSHLLYPALMPAAALLSLSLLSLPAAVGRFPLPMNVLSGLASAALLLFFLTHTWSQNKAYSDGAKGLLSLQKSIKIFHDRTNAPFVFVRDIPSGGALSPQYLPAVGGMMVYDAEKQLLSSSQVVPGAIKDLVAAGKYQDLVMRYDTDLKGLVKVDFGTTASALVSLNGAQIAKKLTPGIEFYKNVHLDEASGELVMESNSASGPVITFSAEGFTPLYPDFLMVEAKIDAPNTGQKPLIELYWLLRGQEKYDEKQRRVWTAASTDNQYRRYYLPLRTTGWVTGGPAEYLTLGFPAGAKVNIRTIAGVSKEQIMPSLALETPVAADRSPYNPPFFNFPTNAEWGLVRLASGADNVTLKHDAGGVPGAAGVMLEVSMPNKSFANPNGNQASGVGAFSLGLKGVRGTYALPMSKFPIPGLYAIRAVAIDASSHPIGQFSDAVYCLVTHGYPTVWSGQ